MDGIIPFFKSHYSLGRSILTLKKRGESKEDEPCSIIDLAHEAGLKDVFLFEDSISGLPEADKNCRDAGLNLRFGIRYTFARDATQKNEESRETECKYGIFAKNQKGIEILAKINSLASNKDHFYYTPRLDFKMLKEFWDESCLKLVVPFYDSFLFKNTFAFSNCVPDFPYTKPVFLIEDNGLIFEDIIKAKITNFTQTEGFDAQWIKSIFYAKTEDFLAYLTFRCINKRTTLERPEMENMSSNRFSFEDWLARKGSNV